MRSPVVGAPRSLRALRAAACRPSGVLALWHLSGVARIVLVSGFAVHLAFAPAHPWVLLASQASPARSARPPPKGAPSEPRQGTVLGGTNTQHKIRFRSIDAPEKRHALGNVSRQTLADMVAGQSVAVEWVKADRYRRKIRKVLLAGLGCNMVQVNRGLAWYYMQYRREQSPTDQQSYAVAEIVARTAQVG